MICAATLRGASLAEGAAATEPKGRWQEASVAEYRQHLIALQNLTRECAAGRDLKTCDPMLIGLDDRVTLTIAQHPEKRMVRYGWLRVLFSHAEESDRAAQPADARRTVSTEAEASKAAPTTSELLQQAVVRLAYDLAQTQKAAAKPATHPDVRGVLDQVMAGREFRGLEQAPEKDTALEKFENWLNHAFSGLGKWRAHSAWVGRALVWGFFALVAVGLAWGLLQIERRWRVKLIPLREAVSPEAPSARDWQLWLADARKSAAAGEWRLAVHFVYWAAIARLESRRMWPADRARTPREYLALLAADDPRRDGLKALTGEFEQVWYGGRDAAEGDFRQAEAWAAAVMAEVRQG